MVTPLQVASSRLGPHRSSAASQGPEHVSWDGTSTTDHTSSADGSHQQDPWPNISSTEPASAGGDHSRMPGASHSHQPHSADSQRPPSASSSCSTHSSRGSHVQPLPEKTSPDEPAAVARSLESSKRRSGPSRQELAIQQDHVELGASQKDLGGKKPHGEGTNGEMQQGRAAEQRLMGMADVAAGKQRPGLTDVLRPSMERLKLDQRLSSKSQLQQQQGVQQGTLLVNLIAWSLLRDIRVLVNL